MWNDLNASTSHAEYITGMQIPFVKSDKELFSKSQKTNLNPESHLIPPSSLPLPPPTEANCYFNLLLRVHIPREYQFTIPRDSLVPLMRTSLGMWRVEACWDREGESSVRHHSHHGRPSKPPKHPLYPFRSSVPNICPG